ncbi:MAG: hypothetical protein LT106_11785 [Burkholderiaceae bacterium]|nr:hypothetical protein [Burkholderiaceae bacterium]
MKSIDSQADFARAEHLNKDCFCIGLDEAALRSVLERQLNAPALYELIRERCPHLFSARPVFVSESHLRRMAAVVRAVEYVVALPAYRDEVLARSPEIAHHDPGGARSAFFGYDFHLAGDRLGLIEINTNAGGAMLNVVLARAQRACCPPIEPLVPTDADAEAFEDRIVSMFRSEWQASGRTSPLRTIAIVDENPEQQYLYPEFLLFRSLFERHGIHAIIADPEALRWRDERLWHRKTVVDLVYNRLTDFALEDEAVAALREAYLEHAVVLTPHPQAHALYADKRNLALLTDRAWLNELGVPEATSDILIENIPRTELVRAEASERLWSSRKRLFFKPAAGFGSRAAYRGDKLTQRVWQEILSANYVAQEIVRPGERAIGAEGAAQVLKFDLRSYVYAGEVQWTAARLYQGQTTNFRTPGGGFAPVYKR